MRTLRWLAFNFAWGLWTALFGLAIPLLWSIGSPARIVRILSRLWARGVLAMLSVIVGLKHVERGREHVPSSPSLIVSNHESTWETLAALVLFPGVAIIAKRELLRIPVMGWYLRRSPMIVIDRDSASKALRKMADESRAALAEGRSVLIFPEGKRRRAGEALEFKRGVELLYRTLDVPVLPVVLNSGNFWGTGGRPKRPGSIVVSFLAPIYPGLSAAAFVTTATVRMTAEKMALDREGGDLPDAGRRESDPRTSVEPGRPAAGTEATPQAVPPVSSRDGRL